MENKSFDIKKIGTLLFGLVSVFVAFAFLINTGVSSIKKLYSELKNERQETQIVKENIATLKKIDLAIINRTDQVFIVMPDKPLVPLLMSNVKAVSDGNLTITSIKSELSDVIDTVNGTSLVYEGESEDILKALSVIDNIQGYSPLTAVDEMNVKSVETKYDVTLKLSTFWAELPTELPQLSEPVKDLTSDETKTLNEVSLFKRPSSSSLTPQNSVDRPNPFI